MNGPSAGGCGDGLLKLLAADLTGARLQEQVVAVVADQHWIVQLLVWDGQLQVTAVFTEHIATVPERRGGTGQKENVLYSRQEFIHMQDPII